MKPTYSDITLRLGALGAFLNYISPFKTSLEAQLLLETTKYSILYQTEVQHYYDTFGYSESETPYCIGMLFIYWIFSNAFACFVLCWKNDNYKLWRSFLSYMSSGHFDSIDLMINAPFTHAMNLFEHCYSGIFTFLLSNSPSQQQVLAHSEPQPVITPQSSSANSIALNERPLVIFVPLLSFISFLYLLFFFINQPPPMSYHRPPVFQASKMTIDTIYEIESPKSTKLKYNLVDIKVSCQFVIVALQLLYIVF